MPFAEKFGIGCGLLKPAAKPREREAHSGFATVRGRHTPPLLVERGGFIFAVFIFIGVFLGVFSPMDLFGAEVVGTVTSAERQVFVTPEGKSVRVPVNRGDTVLFKSTYRTGMQSKLKLLFLDDSILSLGEKSQVQITENIYDPSDDRRSLIANLVGGTLRALAGKIFSRSGSKFEISTPTALASARGTDFIVWVATVNGVPVTGVAGLHGKVVVQNVGPGISKEVFISEKFFTMVKAGFPPVDPEPIPADLLDRLMQAVSASDRVEDALGKPGGSDQVDQKGMVVSVPSPLIKGVSDPPVFPPLDQETNLVSTAIRVEVQFP